MGNPQSDDPQGELPLQDDLHQESLPADDVEGTIEEQPAPDDTEHSSPGVDPEPVDPAIVAEAQRIAAALQEPLLWLVENVIKVLGQAIAGCWGRRAIDSVGYGETGSATSAPSS